MAQNNSFEPDLLLGQHRRDLTDIIKFGDSYTIDETDELSTVFHGKLFDGIDCGSTRGFRMVTFLVFEDVRRASKMRNHLDLLCHLSSRSRLASVRIAKAYCVINVKMPVVPSLPCLVIERVSSITFDEWIGNASVENQLEFFRSLFSTVGCLHQGQLYFGNIRLGIRIIDRFPIFVFPALFEETKLDQGIKSDLKELQGMLQSSTFPRAYDKELFDRLCEKFANDDECNGESLRNGSYLITHCPVVYKPTDKFNIIKRLWEYKALDKKLFKQFTGDTNGKAISTDFMERVRNAKTDCQLKKILRQKKITGTPYKGSPAAISLKKVLAQGTYTDSAEILRFMRDAYEHKPEKNKTWMDIEEMLYDVFPDAYSAIYEMMVERLYIGQLKWAAEGSETMAPIIPFLKEKGIPYHFEF